MRILVVEDDPLIRQFLVEALRDEGHEVVHVADGEAALLWCSRSAAEILITDIQLPGDIDGWQIAERCREHDPDLPVIYASGYFPRLPRPVAGSVVLRKPYHAEDIFRALDQVAKSRPQGV